MIPPSLFLYQDFLIFISFSLFPFVLCHSVIICLTCLLPVLSPAFFYPHHTDVLSLVSSPPTCPLLFCSSFGVMRSAQQLQFVLEQGQWIFQAGSIAVNTEFRALYFLTSWFHFNICCTFLLSSLSYMFYRQANSPCSLGSVWRLSTNL